MTNIQVGIFNIKKDLENIFQRTDFTQNLISL